MAKPYIKKDPEIDWVHLPADTHPQGLWDCLHDAALRTVRSDLLNRTVIMTFDVFYIRKHHKLPENTLFNFIFDDVTSARVTTYAIWPGKFALPKSASHDEQARLIKEYQSKWREESLGWNEFEKSLQKKKTSLDVLDPELATNDHVVSIRIGGLLNDKYHNIFIRAGKLTIQQSDGQTLKLNEFIRLGREYWTAFSADG
jgi:hypothetical protein